MAAAAGGTRSADARWPRRSRQVVAACASRGSLSCCRKARLDSDSASSDMRSLEARGAENCRPATIRPPLKRLTVHCQFELKVAAFSPDERPLRME